MLRSVPFGGTRTSGRSADLHADAQRHPDADPNPDTYSDGSYHSDAVSYADARSYANAYGVRNGCPYCDADTGNADVLLGSQAVRLEPVPDHLHLHDGLASGLRDDLLRRNRSVGQSPDGSSATMKETHRP